MSARLLDGRRVAETVRAEVAEGVKRLAGSGAAPGLAVVLVGNDPASEVYVASKDRAAREAGIRASTIKLPATATEREVLDVVARLNADDAVDGILVQMPLPKQIDARKVLAAVSPGKDVDGFHPINQGLLLEGHPRFVPATPRGVVELLARERVPLEGKDVVVLGRSTIVGKPLAALLLTKGIDATVTVAHSRTRDVAAHTRRADVLVAAIGVPGFVKADMVKPGAVVVDVGINRVPDATAPKGSRLVGDVDFAPVSAVASAITPVPGGVGPMTIAMVLANTLDAARMRRA
ncbi:MAG TPA: bifunctional methylenetetrahydrofolate dehydrogenase/methenyltetrahydrofolate cyclohydrolase FolD [Candidatus Thermoplasmatota archaeon]|nr:bifunctional methylenetetrahydrofolate dehydrogenase/methenyltetrahydrofolate cyclohydrolase FolD [Candidatus Thermoplasmatota archaeon]